MSDVPLHRRMRALTLVAPLFVFLALFFVWPLASMMKQAISDPAVAAALPKVAAASAGWNRTSPATPEMKKALVETA